MRVKADSKGTGPDVLHVGFSKCASTFLQSYFEEHEQVFLVNQSHYFAPFSLSVFPNESEQYLERFSAATDDQVRLESDEHIILPLFHPVLGAAATTMESTREVVRRIQSIQPDARIVIVIRNQVSLIVSRYSEYILCGGTHTFKAFVDEFLCCSIDQQNYFQNYYAQIYQVLCREFSPDNVLLLLQEDLARSEPETIAKLSTFLQVQAIVPAKKGFIARRIGLSRLGISVMRTINQLLVVRPKQSYHEAITRGPHFVYKSLQRGLRVIDYILPAWLKGDKNSVIDQASVERIRQEFREDNDELAGILKRDLVELGY